MLYLFLRRYIIKSRELKSFFYKNANIKLLYFLHLLKAYRRQLKVQIQLNTTLNQNSKNKVNAI